MKRSSLLALVLIAFSASSAFSSDNRPISGRYQGFFEFNRGTTIVFYELMSIRVTRSGRIAGFGEREDLPEIGLEEEDPDLEDPYGDGTLPPEDLVEPGIEPSVITRVRITGRLARGRSRGDGTSAVTIASAKIKLSDGTRIRGRFFSRTRVSRTPTFAGVARSFDVRPVRVSLFTSR